jgi:peptide chain release factor 1
MVPIEKVKDIISQYDILEKELSSGNIDPKLFAKKSKEYSRLGRIILTARQFVNFENEKNDLENMTQDKTNDQEMVDLAQKDLNELIKRNEKNENDLKLFLLPKDEDDDKNAIVEIRAGTGGLEAS